MKPPDWEERATLYMLTLYGYGLLTDAERTRIRKRIAKAAETESRGCTCLEQRTNRDGSVRPLHMSDCALITECA